MAREEDEEDGEDGTLDPAGSRQLHAAFIFYSKHSPACRQMQQWWNDGVDSRLIKRVSVDSPVWRPLIADRVPVVPSVWLLYSDGTSERASALKRVWPLLAELGCLTAPLALRCPPAPRPRPPPPPQPQPQPQSQPAPFPPPSVPVQQGRTPLTTAPSTRPLGIFLDAPPQDENEGGNEDGEASRTATKAGDPDMFTDLMGTGDGKMQRNMIGKGVKKPSIMEAAMQMKTEYEQHLKSNSGPGGGDRSRTEFS